MRKMLSAYLNRLFKDPTFWVAVIGMLFLAALSVFSGIQTHLDYPDDPDYALLDTFYFSTAPYIGLFAAVVTSTFLGTEYADGTIRNKLIVGHTRNGIYFCSLVMAIFISSCLTLCWAVGGLVGIPALGLWDKTPLELFLYFAVIFGAAAATSAIFTMISLLLTNRTGAAIFEIFAAFGLIMCASILYNRLCEPPTTIDGVVISADGTVEFGDTVANPAYVGGVKRTIFTILVNIIPAGQMILADEGKLTHPVYNLAASAAILLVCTLLGCWFYRNKDLK